MNDNELTLLAPVSFQPDKLAILASLQCDPDNSALPAMSLAYDRVIGAAQASISLAAGFVLSEPAPGRPAIAAADCRRWLYCLVTAGRRIDELSSEYFRQGLYAEGLLADAIANFALFDCSRQLYRRLACEAKERRLGLTGRISPGDGDVPLELQRAILGKFGNDNALGVGLTETLMLDPVKSLAYVYGADEALPYPEADRSCSACANTGCSLRQPVARPDEVLLTLAGDPAPPVAARPAQSILAALAARMPQLQALCGGQGRCGKCKVRLLRGQVFSTAPSEQGVYLACRTYPLTDCEIALDPSLVASYQAVSDFQPLDYAVDSGYQRTDATAQVLGLAIDIGTTTLALSLVELDSGRLAGSRSRLNSQRRFGADVISRIQYGAGAKLAELRASICGDLLECIREFAPEVRQSIRQVAIAGNTTMLHFLMGLPAEALGRYPFQPVTTDLQEFTFAELFGEALLDCRVTILPGLSAFVGADVMAGLLQCDFAANDGISMLIDVGTNGEIALGNQDRILCVSAAAGPAFEGASLSCGVGSVAGAIASFAMEGDAISYITIDGAEPVGVCGSGALDIMAACVREQVVDETGAFDLTRYPDAGLPLARDRQGNWLVFSQKDVRELQLAKAAIRAGIDVLLAQYGCDCGAVESVYLAGSFGAYLKVASAVTIGMLPRALQARVKAAGNTSLGGAVRFLLTRSGKADLAKLLAVSRHLDLAADQEFNERFIANMYFRPDPDG